jgi:hypothetical protein
MGRVKKDILNGWKEIGGYVCRDIRTVERWEKHRGLPVRRVPGAGRATVYALISEVDEWLASAKIDEAEEVPESVSAPQSSFAAVSSAPMESDVAIRPTVESTLAVESPASEAVSEETHGRDRVGLWSRFPIRSVTVGFGMAAVIALLFAVVWPLMVQARRDTPLEKVSHVERAGDDGEPSRTPPNVPYRSAVSGVDDLYLSGLYFCEQRTPNALQQALENFNAAIAKDPNYAPAYAGLANTYNLLREYSGMPQPEAYGKAKAAAERAIKLDPKLPQAHASLGFVDFFWAWDAAAAEKEFQTALSLDPSSGLAHHWYGSMLTHEGRYAEAIEQLDVAQRLQPTSAAIVSLRALATGLSGHRDEAVTRLEEILKEAPSATSPHNVLSTLSLMEPRDIPRYLSESRRVAELRHDEDWMQVSDVALRAYRSGGERAMWQAMLANQKRLHPETWERTYPMVDAEAALGNRDEMFAILFRLADDHDPNVIGVFNDALLRPMRGDPRYAQLVKKIGLPTPAGQ